MSEEIVGNDELQENVAFKGLEDIERNGISDWLQKESTQLVTPLLAPQEVSFPAFLAFSCHLSLAAISSHDSWPKEFLKKQSFERLTKIKRANDSVNLIGYFKIIISGQNAVLFNKLL